MEAYHSKLGMNDKLAVTSHSAPSLEEQENREFSYVAPLDKVTRLEAEKSDLQMEMARLQVMRWPTKRSR